MTANIHISDDNTKWTYGKLWISDGNVVIYFTSVSALENFKKALEKVNNDRD